MHFSENQHESFDEVTKIRFSLESVFTTRLPQFDYNALLLNRLKYLLKLHIFVDLFTPVFI